MWISGQIWAGFHVPPTAMLATYFCSSWISGYEHPETLLRNVQYCCQTTPLTKTASTTTVMKEWLMYRIPKESTYLVSVWTEILHYNLTLLKSSEKCWLERDLNSHLRDTDLPLYVPCPSLKCLLVIIARQTTLFVKKYPNSMLIVWALWWKRACKCSLTSCLKLGRCRE